MSHSDYLWGVSFGVLLSISLVNLAQAADDPIFELVVSVSLAVVGIVSASAAYYLEKTSDVTETDN